MKPTAKIKPKPKKQHDVRGASFIRLAKRVRKIAKDQASTEIGVSLSMTLCDLADAIEAEGKATSKLR